MAGEGSGGLGCCLSVMAGRVAAICASTAGGRWPGLRPAMTERETTLLRQFSYHAYGACPGHDEGAKISLRYLP